MRKNKLFNIFTHPLSQLCSFSILIFPGQLFDLPYLLVLRWTIADPAFFTISGILGLLLTFLSILIYRKILQWIALLIMWLSLIAFVWQLTPTIKLAIIENPISLITCLQFLLISFLIVSRKYYGRTA
ncbi:MAG: hypothetical protein ACO1NK_12445 [Sediminibacterium sp.]